MFVVTRKTRQKEKSDFIIINKIWSFTNKCNSFAVHPRVPGTYQSTQDNNDFINPSFVVVLSNAQLYVVCKFVSLPGTTLCITTVRRECARYEYNNTCVGIPIYQSSMHYFIQGRYVHLYIGSSTRIQVPSCLRYRYGLNRPTTIVL